MADDKKYEGCTSKDEVTILPAPGGNILAVRHKADHTIESAITRPLRDGDPIVGDALALKQIEGNRFAVVDTIHGTPVPTTTNHAGPAQVATDRYREGWARIFGGRQEVGLS